MCYVFDSLQENFLLNQGDSIALMIPVFTPYIEIPELRRYQFDVTEISADQMTPDGLHTWQYKDEDIDNLSTYSKELAEDNIKKDLEIKLLTKEVNDFKSGKTYKEQNRIIDSQKKIISEKDNEINIWKNKFEEITNEFKMFKKKIQNKIFSLTSKIFDILHIPYTWYEANDIDFAIDKTNSYLKKHSKSKDDFER